MIGCSSAPKILYQEEHRLAKWNFRYRKDVADEWLVYGNINQPFAGDCEDFSLTLQRQIGGKVHYTIHDKVGAHAILIKDNIVYENMSKIPYKVEDFMGKIYHEMKHTGDVINN